MFDALKKTIGVCLMGLGLRNIIGIVASSHRMAFSNRGSSSYYWNYVAVLKKIEINVKWKEML